MYTEYNNEKKINRNALARLIIWSVVLVILSGLFLSAIIFKGDDSMFGFNTYRYDDADSYAVGAGQTTEDIVELDIDWIDGQVKMIPTDGDKVIISEDYQGKNEEHRLRWKVENGKLLIKYRASGSSFGISFNKGKNLTIEIPRSVWSRMKNVEISLVSAELIATEMAACEVDITSVSGDLMLSGSVGQLNIETVSGDVKIDGSVESLDLEGVSARVELSLMSQPKSLDIETVSGDVRIYLPADVSGFEATMDSVSGRISVSDFENVTTAKGYSRYGDGSVKIQTEAVSGNLKIGKTVAD